MQTALVVVIVAAAAIYVGRVFYSSFKQKGNCACGCSCCDIGDTCDALPNGRSREISSGRHES